MKCYIEIKRTEKCVACSKTFSDSDKAIPVRIQDNMGYSINVMCEDCMDTYSAYKKRKAALIGTS